MVRQTGSPVTSSGSVSIRSAPIGRRDACARRMSSTSGAKPPAPRITMSVIDQAPQDSRTAWHTPDKSGDQRLLNAKPRCADATRTRSVWSMTHPRGQVGRSNPVPPSSSVSAIDRARGLPAYGGRVWIGRNTWSRLDSVFAEVSHQCIARHSERRFLDRKREEPRCRLGPICHSLESDFRHVGKVSPVGIDDSASRGNHLLRTLQLGTEHRAGDICQAVVVPNHGKVVAAIGVHALTAEESDTLLEIGIVDGERAAFTGRQDLVAVERKGGDRRE